MLSPSQQTLTLSLALITIVSFGPTSRDQSCLSHFVDRETEICGHKTDEQRGWAWNSVSETDSSPESLLLPGMVTLSLSPDDSSCLPPTLAPPVGGNVVLTSQLPAPQQTIYTSLSRWHSGPFHTSLSHSGLILAGGLRRGYANPLQLGLGFCSHWEPQGGGREKTPRVGPSPKPGQITCWLSVEFSASEKWD